MRMNLKKLAHYRAKNLAVEAKTKAEDKALRAESEANCPTVKPKQYLTLNEKIRNAGLNRRH